MIISGILIIYLLQSIGIMIGLGVCSIVCIVLSNFIWFVTQIDYYSQILKMNNMIKHSESNSFAGWVFLSITIICLKLLFDMHLQFSWQQKQILIVSIKQIILSFYSIITYNRMIRPQKHNSLKKLSPNSKNRSSNQRANGSIKKNRFSQEKDNLNISNSKNINDHKHKKAISKLRIRTNLDQTHVATQMSHRPGHELKSPCYKAFVYKKKRLHANLESRLMNQTNYHLKLQDHEQPCNSSKHKSKMFLPSQRMKKHVSTQKSEVMLTGKHKRPDQKTSNISLKKKRQFSNYLSESLQKLDCYKNEQKKIQGTLKRQNKNRAQKFQAATMKGDIKEKRRNQNSSSFKLRIKSKQRQSSKRQDKSPDNNINIEFRHSARKNRNPFQLSKQQLETFGDRFPGSFQKLKLLGRGGFSLVWLGVHKKNGKQFAIKQIHTENEHQTHIKQIWFGTYFFDIGGVPKKQFKQHPGIKNLVRLYSYDIDRSDTWIFYQKCGQSLGNALYDLQPQAKSGDKVYRMVTNRFYESLKKDQSQLRKIIIQVSQALLLLSENNIVHSDLKTQNILVRLDQKKQKVEDVKLIDYGSSFTFGNLKQFSMATPEYMAPEILNYILYENQQEYAPKLLQFLEDYNNPWVIDTWSLGCVIFEIVSGIPLWMSLKTIVKVNEKQYIKTGAFASKGRLFQKIIKKQLGVVQNMQHELQNECFSGMVLDRDIKHVMKRMLAIDPNQRISPQQTINYLKRNI